jgi:hypothetical protein
MWLVALSLAAVLITNLLGQRLDEQTDLRLEELRVSREASLAAEARRAEERARLAEEEVRLHGEFYRCMEPVHEAQRQRNDERFGQGTITFWTDPEFNDDWQSCRARVYGNRPNF